MRSLLRSFRSSLALSAALGALALGPLGCVDADDLAESEFQSNEVSPLGAEADAQWRDYLDTVDLDALQDGCRPFRSELPEGVAYRGVAVLFHGFTACPQQYEELAARLGEEGYVALVPVLPGHGRKATLDASGKVVDDVSQLPDDEHRDRYAELGRTMDAIALAAKGERVVAGLSVGGAVAARAAEEGSGFERALLLNSFFDASGVVALLLGPANAVHPNERMGWGEGCEKERARGRAGYCQFAFTHLRAVQRFGQESADRAEGIEILTQNVGVQADPAASPKAIAKVGDQLAAGTTCFFEKGVNHSLLSRFDSPDEDKYWLPAAFDQIARFVATGKRFDHAGLGAQSGYPFCRSR